MLSHLRPEQLRVVRACSLVWAAIVTRSATRLQAHGQAAASLVVGFEPCEPPSDAD
jgi:hypothetical protein